MTISDQSRYDLHQRLAEVLGASEAATLMEHLPPVGWADVATKRDLDHSAMTTGIKVDQLGRELRLEIAVLRADLQAEMHEGFGLLRGEVGLLRGEVGRQLGTLLLGLFGLQVSAGGLVVALSRLL